MESHEVALRVASRTPCEISPSPPNAFPASPSQSDDSLQREILEAIRALQLKLDAFSEGICARPAHAADVTPKVPDRDLSEYFPMGTQGSNLHHSESGAEMMTIAACGPSLTLSEQLSGRTEFVGSCGRTDLMNDSYLRLRPGWDRTPMVSERFINSSRRPGRSSLFSNDSEVEAESSLKSALHAWNPDSMSRTFFDVVSIVMLLYDAFMVPYQLAWEIDTETAVFLQVALWTTRIFWTADLFLNLVTGYRDTDAKLVLNLSRTMRHYLYTFFLPDLALVSCDWLTLFDIGGHNSWMRWMRVMRLVRSGRQVVRGYTLVLKAKLLIQGSGFHLIMDLSVFMIAILWVNHIVCCGWYSIGKYHLSDTGLTWLSMEEYNISDHYDYWTAMHWAMTQMTPGSMEVRPRSSGERIYNVSILLLGLLMGSSLVATLTSMLTQYKLRVEGSSRKFMILHQFLVQQGVDPNLAMAIKLQVRSRCKEKQRLKLQDVEYLDLLSNSIKGKLRYSWCMRQLAGHQLFNSLQLVDPPAVRILCKDAITSLEFPKSEVVFEEGAQGENMYIVTFGHLRYFCLDVARESILHDLDSSFSLPVGSWCGEPALWTLWRYLGSLEATTTSEVLALNGPKLQTCLEPWPNAFHIVQDYCMAFHSKLSEPGTVRSDLPHVLDICEVMCSLPMETRLELANPVLDTLESRFWEGVPFISTKSLELLKAEVLAGKCDVGMVDSEVVRHTFIVALHLFNGTSRYDRFLVRIGEVPRDTGQVVATCLLPGTKRQWGENYVASVNRILEKELSEVAQHVEVKYAEGSQRTVVMRDSPTYGIRTRYARSAFKATLSSSAKMRYLRSPLTGIQPPAVNTASWILRPEYRRSLVGQKEAAAVLSEHTTVGFTRCGEKNKTKAKLYLWLTQHEFSVLSTDNAKPIIQQWLSSMESLQEELRVEDSLVESRLEAKTGPRSDLPESLTSEVIETEEIVHEVTKETRVVFSL